MRLSSTRAAATVAASAALVAGGLAVAPAATADVLAPRTTFTMDVDETNGSVTPPASGEAIPNVDSVKSTIRTYYAAVGGLADRTASPYISEVKALEAKILDAVPETAPVGSALVFDTDDTLLWNYDYEDKGSAFVYNPATNAQWVTGRNADGTPFDCLGGTKTGDFCFPAVPGMPAVLRALHDRGYPLFVVTGRPATQEQATVDNLTAAGFVDGSGDPLFTTANVFAKDVTAPWLDCAQDGTAATSCSTVEWKAQTRRHIEAGADQSYGNGDDRSILLNVGDQLSDLWGGYTAPSAAVKIPNPTYFLSSPDLVTPGPNDQASTLTAPSTFTMAPDGSTGRTAKGDEIPNIDPVRTEIRAYYGATGGIANKSSSPYISELTALQRTWTSQIATACQRGAAKVAAAHTAIANARAAVVQDTRAVARATRAVHGAQRAVKRAHGKAKAVAKRRLRAAQRVLASARRELARDQRTLAGITVPKSPAAVFDADDTTLWTYDMEDGNPAAEHPGMQFNFNPTLQNTWVQNQWFPATPGMPALVRAVKTAGCTVVGLTGRNTSQQAATIANLTKVGYVDAAGRPLFTAANYYTKWVSGATPPAYLDCGDDRTCSTIEYKSGTREYLETQRGLDVVANLGDQFSDLHGGYADAKYKLPNPTYYLP